MSWANLDDRLHAHPKVRRLQRIPFAGAEAFGIWCWCLSWCRSFSPTSGLLSVADVAADWGCDLDHMAGVFDLLLTVRLVDELDGDPDAYTIHDWADWQLSGQQRGGLHRAETAVREGGRFVVGDQPRPAPPATEELVGGGSPGGRTTPRLSVPLHSTPLRAGDERIASDQESDFRRKVTAPA
jgi:hypothetical protein